MNYEHLYKEKFKFKLKHVRIQLKPYSHILQSQEVNLIKKRRKSIFFSSRDLIPKLCIQTFKHVIFIHFFQEIAIANTNLIVSHKIISVQQKFKEIRS